MVEHSKNIEKTPNIFLLIILISIGTIAAQFYITAIPDMATFFRISISEASWTMTVFLIGYAIGQLIYGPLGNFFGRKGGFTIGILSTFLASILCIASITYEKYWAMLLGRFLMAAGASSGLSLTLTVIKDCYAGAKQRKITSFAISAFSILPGVAIAINGGMNHYFGWTACFYLMAFYCIFVLWILQFLPETKSRTLQSTYFKGYAAALKSPILLLCSCMMGAATAGIYLFSTYAPPVAMNFFKYTQFEFGLLNFIPNFSLFLGVMFSAFYVDRFSGKSMIHIGGLLYMIGALIFLILMKVAGGEFWGFIFSVTIMFLGIPVVYSNAASLATAELEDVSNGSSVMSALNLCIGSVAVFITSLWDHTLHIALPIIYTFFSLLILLLLFFLRSFRMLENEE